MVNGVSLDQRARLLANLHKNNYLVKFSSPALIVEGYTREVLVEGYT